MLSLLQGSICETNSLKQEGVSNDGCFRMTLVPARGHERGGAATGCIWGARLACGGPGRLSHTLQKAPLAPSRRRAGCRDRRASVPWTAWHRSLLPRTWLSSARGPTSGWSTVHWDVMLESVPDSLGSHPSSPHLYNQYSKSIVVKVNGEGSHVLTGGMWSRRAIFGRRGPGSGVRGGGGEAEGGQEPAPGGLPRNPL